MDTSRTISEYVYTYEQRGKEEQNEDIRGIHSHMVVKLKKPTPKAHFRRDFGTRFAKVCESKYNSTFNVRDIP